jgi:hypothetical protein
MEGNISFILNFFGAPLTKAFRTYFEIGLKLQNVGEGKAHISSTVFYPSITKVDPGSFLSAPCCSKEAVKENGRRSHDHQSDR